MKFSWFSSFRFEEKHDTQEGADDKLGNSTAETNAGVLA